MLKYFFNYSKQYILIFLIGVFFSSYFYPCYSKQNNFYVDNIEISMEVDLNFNREKIVNELLKKAFDSLLLKVLLSKDHQKFKGASIHEIKQLIANFQIFDESYNDTTYTAKSNIFFDQVKIASFFEEKNFVFSNPKKISVVLIPILYDQGEIKLFTENIFFKKWNKSKNKSNLIEFILPLEDLEEIKDITASEDKPNEINILNIAKKYNTENYVVSFMEYKDKKLRTFLEMNLNNEKFNINFVHNYVDINNEENVTEIIKDSKIKILDSWKQANIVNFLLPLSINIHFENQNLKNHNDLQKIMESIEIINKYSIKEFSYKKTIFDVDYFGDPKKLYNEFLNFGYKLSQEQGLWFVVKNE